jgi:7-keto-8-aminopelargonate synthetase-like enzyme
MYSRIIGRAASTAPAKLIAVDAVYSMDGDEAPLAALLHADERCPSSHCAMA